MATQRFDEMLVTITLPRWLAERGKWDELEDTLLIDVVYEQLVDQDCWLNEGDVSLESDGVLKNYAAVALGRLGGRKGGLARAAALSPERRREIARQAAVKRWSVQKDERSRQDGA